MPSSPRESLDVFRAIVAGEVEPPPVAKLVGFEMTKINFMKPVWQAHLVAEGELIKAGRTIGLVEGRVTDDPGSLAAFATATCMTLCGDAAEGR